MFSQLKQSSLIKSVSTYTLLNMINSGIPIALLPVLTTYLTASDFGLLTNFNAIFFFIVPFMGLSINASVSRQYYKKEVVFNQYNGNALLIVILNFVIISSIVFILLEEIGTLTSLPVNIILSVSFYSFIHILFELLLTIWRLENKALKFGIFRISRSAFEIGLSLLFIIHYDQDWYGRILGIYISSVIGFIFLIFYFIKNNIVSFSFNKNYISHFLKYSSPLIIHSVCGIIMIYSDKLIISNMIGISENGVYSVAFQIGMVISLFQNSFNLAWVPWLYERLSGKKTLNKLQLVKITYVYFALMIILAILLYLVTPMLFYFIGSEFKGGEVYVAWIGFGFAFNGMCKMMINYLYYIEKTRIIMFITLTVAALNICLTIVFIKLFGTLGAAISNTISFFAQFIITWIVSQRYYPMPWNLKHS